MNNYFLYYIKQKNMFSNKTELIKKNQVINDNTLIKLEELIHLIKSTNHKLSSQDHLDGTPL